MAVNPPPFGAGFNPELALEAQLQGYYSIYRYFTTDLLTNEILAEIPFKDVSWERSIKAAGKFTGKIEVIEETKPYNLYETTLPGKTGLYVMRDGVCVWGGLIWSRNYDIVSRTMQVDAAEFTSYLFHRVAWKTVKHSFTATVESNNGFCVVTLTDYDEYASIRPGSSVNINFRLIDQQPFDGYYTVTSVLNQETSVFTITIPGLPSGVYALATATLRADTYDYVRHLLDSTFVDFFNIPFQNDEIEPGVGVDHTIFSAGISGQVGTITTTTPHKLVVGQSAFISNLNSNFNGAVVVTSTPSIVTFTYDAIGEPNRPTVNPLTKSYQVVQKTLNNYIATLTTNGDHQFFVGDTVNVQNVDDGQSSIGIFNGVHTIINIPAPNQFSYATIEITNLAPTGSSGSVSNNATVTTGTYGSYPFSGDLLIQYSTNQFSGANAESVILRGHELRSIGEELNNYSDILDGFEYRIDCDFVGGEGGGFFTRTFKFLPIRLKSTPTGPNDLTPFYNDAGYLTVFEYPGSIDQFTLDESAENVATRFFVGGNIPELGNDVSQPYAAATAQDLISLGWPLLEEVENRNDISDEGELFSYAERYLLESRPPVTKMTVSVVGSRDPVIGTYYPGDWCGLIIDDEFFQERLASPLEPRSDILIRKIETIKVSVPNVPNFPEKVTLDLIPEWELDKGTQG
jgi:hypothetical protein